MFFISAAVVDLLEDRDVVVGEGGQDGSGALFGVDEVLVDPGSLDVGLDVLDLEVFDVVHVEAEFLLEALLADQTSEGEGELVSIGSSVVDFPGHEHEIDISAFSFEFELEGLFS